MIRLTGIVNLKPVGSLKEEELTDKQKKLDVDKDGEIEGSDLAKLRTTNEELEEGKARKPGEVWQLPNGKWRSKSRGERTGTFTNRKNAEDHAKSSAKYGKQSSYKWMKLENPKLFDNTVNEDHGEDHEVSMAHNTLDDIIKSATELKAKLGDTEKNIPAWIQDHISQAQNFISQAVTNYHEYHEPPTPAMHEDMCEGEGCEEVNEVAPEGWEGSVKAMKKHPEIDNPWALAYYMKKKGYQSHKGAK